jgi:1-phosphatidylinositol phosphodiesterase
MSHLVTRYDVPTRCDLHFFRSNKMAFMPDASHDRLRSHRARKPAVENLESRIALTASLANWMSAIPDATSIGDMSIPGTHDTMTYGRDVYLVQSQDMSLTQELDDGIRFLDIRLGGLQIPGGTSHSDLGLYHGSFYLNATFVTNVVDTCQTFLAENPSETIIMSIKKEYDNGLTSRQFARIVDQIINSTYKDGNPSDGYLFYTRNSVPELGTVRGQIVLLRRYTDPHHEGINATQWQDNPSTPFSISAQFQHHGPGSIVIEDHYEPAGSAFDLNPFENYPAIKQANIDNLITEANTEPAGVLNWYITFSSATDVTSGPQGFANYENPRLEKYLSTLQGLVGTIVMDFPTNDLIEEIVDHNQA